MALLTGAWHYFDRTLQQRGQLEQFATSIHLSLLPLLENRDRQLLQAQLNHMRYVSALPIATMAIYDQKHRVLAESDNIALLEGVLPEQAVTERVIKQYEGQWLLIQPLYKAAAAEVATVPASASEAYLVLLVNQQLNFTEWLIPLLLVLFIGLLVLKAIHNTLLQAASRQHTDVSLLTHKLFQLRQGQQGIRIDAELVAELQPIKQAINEFAEQHEINQQRFEAELQHAIQQTKQESERNTQLQRDCNVAKQDYLRLQQIIRFRLANLNQLLAQSGQLEPEQFLVSLRSVINLLYLEQITPSEHAESVNCLALVDDVISELHPVMVAQHIDLQVIETGSLANFNLLLDKSILRSLLTSMLQLISRVSASSDVVLRLDLKTEQQPVLQLSISCNGNSLPARIAQLLNATDTKALQWHEADIGSILAVRQHHAAEWSLQSLEGLGFTLTLSLPVNIAEKTAPAFKHVLLFDSSPLLAERSNSLSSVAKHVVSCHDTAELQRNRRLHRYDMTLLFLPSPVDVPQWQQLLAEGGWQNPVLLYARVTEQPKWQQRLHRTVSEVPFCLAHLDHVSQPNMIPRLLVVDDNATNLAFIRVLLQQEPVQLTTAASGNEALQLCMQQVFDIILLDIQLPDICGTEVALQLRQLAAYQEIPILAFTAHALEQEIHSFKASGMNDVILKPLDAAKLEQILYWCSRGKNDYAGE